MLNHIFDETLLKGLRLKNRLIKSATYEGRCINNSVSKDLIDWHTQIAKGGVAMTTLAYCSVAPDGITLPEQIILRKEILPDLRNFTDSIHRENTAASIQLTHCGFFTRNKSLSPDKPISPSKTFNKYGFFSGLPFSRQIEKIDFTKLKLAYKSAAQISLEAGFDAIELHMGHGYLLSQFLSPAMNKRKDHYGGSLANRARFPLAVLREILVVTGDKIPLIVKLNLEDGFKNGFSLIDCIEFSKMLKAEGVSALELSGGFTSINALYLLRGGRPLWSMIENENNILQKLAMAMFGPLVVKKYPFQELYFREAAIKVKKEVDLPLIYVGGAFSKESIEKVIIDGFDFIALGRPLIYDPEFPINLKNGKETKSGCTACNECIAFVGSAPTHCVLTTAE